MDWEVVFAESRILAAKGFSLRNIAKYLKVLFEIDMFTENAIRLRIQRRLKEPEKAHGNRRFTDDEEDIFAAFLDGMSLSHRGLTRKAFLSLMKQYCKDDPGWNPSQWFAGFMERHRDRLTLATIKALGDERVDPKTLRYVEEWVDWFPEWMAKNGLSWKHIINVDETRISLEGEQNKVKRIESARKRKKSGKKVQRGRAATLLPFVSSAEKVIMSVFVLPQAEVGDSSGWYKFYLKKLARSVRGMGPVFYTFIKSGWLDGVAWRAICKKLREVLQIESPGIRPVLLMDNLKVHTSDDSLRTIIDGGIYPWFPPCPHDPLPPNPWMTCRLRLSSGSSTSGFPKNSPPPLPRDDDWGRSSCKVHNCYYPR